MEHGRRFLKVKIKSLAAEAGIIRLEERRSRGALRDELHLHRVLVVRREACAAQFAYAFLRGRTLARTAPSWVGIGVTSMPVFKMRERVTELVRKYGNKDAHLDLVAWFESKAPELVAVPEVSNSQATGSTPVGRSKLSSLFFDLFG